MKFKFTIIAFLLALAFRFNRGASRHKRSLMDFLKNDGNKSNELDSLGMLFNDTIFETHLISSLVNISKLFLKQTKSSI